MGFFELLLIAVSMSMDAFAVSICKGLSVRKVTTKQMLTVGSYFGGFQGLMPVIGFALTSLFASLITSVSHWIAFVLLLFIGGKMLWDVYKESPAETSPQADEAAAHSVYTPLRFGELTLLAIATSIDALAVGVAFAVLPGIHILSAAGFIGCTTFVLSFAGVVIGYKTGKLLEKRAQVLGGIILIAIGFKILFEHTGILG
jgi:putative Mn2+ efflux pump MntP